METNYKEKYPNWSESERLTQQIKDLKNEVENQKDVHNKTLSFLAEYGLSWRYSEFNKDESYYNWREMFENRYLSKHNFQMNIRSGGDIYESDRTLVLLFRTIEKFVTEEVDVEKIIVIIKALLDFSVKKGMLDKDPTEQIDQYRDMFNLVSFLVGLKEEYRYISDNLDQEARRSIFYNYDNFISDSPVPNPRRQ